MPSGIGRAAGMELKSCAISCRSRAPAVSAAQPQELGLAQPALSRQIKKLEQELGVSLFARHGRGVRLSAAGSMLLERAETIAQLVHQTGEEIRDDRSPARWPHHARRAAGGRTPAHPAVRRTISENLAADDAAYARRRRQFAAGMADGKAHRYGNAAQSAAPGIAGYQAAPERTHVRHRTLGAARQAAQAAASFRIRDLAELPLILPNMAHNNRRLVEHAATRTRCSSAHQDRSRQRRFRQGDGREGPRLHHSHLRRGAG